MRTMGLLAFTLIGCLGGKPSQSGEDTDSVGQVDDDNDQDGWSTADDCDDRNPAVNPGAEETCNRIDDNCDGAIDEGAPADAWTWYPDADIDGYGDAAQGTTACQGPAGTVPIGGDCDDANRAVNPGAPEVCDGADNDCDSAIDEGALDAPLWYPDLDEDGYGDDDAPIPACEAPAGSLSAGGDCDDDDPAAHPGAAEVCDAADNDCDGAIDDDAIDAAPYYADADHDGYGDPAALTLACAAPANSAANDDDCDDHSAATSPASAEVCDGDDNDCDGAIDEDATDATRLYADADADTYGDPATTTLACASLAGWVTNDDDCDDADNANHPGAAERCDGEDNDCLGDVDEADAIDAGTFYPDADRDGFGTTGTTTRACAAPAGYAETSDDCDDADPSVNPGEAEVCDNAQDDNCDGTDDGCLLSGAVSTPDALWVGPGSFDNAGAAVALGDLSGDGKDELLIGVDHDDISASASGSIFVIAGPSATGGTLSTTAALATLSGVAASDHAGAALASADLDADGYADLLVGAPDADTGGAGAGDAYLLYGPLSGSIGLGSADALLIGEDASDLAGTSFATGDLDGDGILDLAIGAEGEDAGGLTAGAAYVFFGAPTGTVDLSAAEGKLTATSGGDAVGYSLAIADDLDGDGLGELIIGAQSDDTIGSNGGAVYIIDGVAAATRSVSTYTAFFTGAAAGDTAGTDVSAGGDLNGDGYGDVLVGAPKNAAAATNAGAAYLLAGPCSGTGTLSAKGLALTGISSGDLAGAAVSLLGDVDGDGQDDLAVGASGRDGSATTDDGAVYLFYGPLTASTSLSAADAILAGPSKGQHGAALARGDANGDGLIDLLVGAEFYSATAGAASLYLGSGGW